MNQDINLMPKPKKKEYKGLKAFGIILLILLLVALVYYFVILPKFSEKKLLKNQLDLIKQQSAKYETTEITHAQLKQEVSTTEDMVAALSVFKEGQDVAQLLIDIESCFPVEIKVLNLSYTADEIDISATTSLDDDTMAVLINQLRSLESTYNVSISNYGESEGVQTFGLIISLTENIEEELALEATETNQQSELINDVELLIGGKE